MSFYKPFYDVNSPAYLMVFFVFALVETLLCSGITYGWASIVVVFKLEYFYINLCEGWYKTHNETLPTPQPAYLKTHPNSSIVGGGAGFYSSGELPGCPIQDARLNLIFTVSLFCLCGIKFPAGVFIDKFGPRMARIVGGSLYVVASLGLGFVAIGYENFLFPIFACICMGGSLLVVSVYQVSNIIFRRSRSRVMCILHGAFDSSAVFLLVFKIIYENGVRFRYIMYGYSLVCFVLILVGTVFLIPPLDILFKWVEEENEMTGRKKNKPIVAAGPDFAVRSYTTEQDFAVFSIQYGTCDKEEKCTLSTSEDEYNPMDSSDEIIPEAITDNDTDYLVSKSTSRFARGSVLRSVFSLLYAFELIYLITFQLKLWYFVGSLADFLERITRGKVSDQENVVSNYINLFGYIQFGGILITPLIGLIFDRDSLSGNKEKAEEVLTPAEIRLRKLQICVVPFAITNVLCMIFCLLSFFEDLRVQIVAFVLYTTVRGFLYANHGTFMGVAFPPSQFGTLYGLGIFIGGCFGILQYALFEFTTNVLKGNPFYTNLILFVLVTIGNIFPVYLWWYCRQEKARIEKRSIRTRTSVACGEK